MTDDRRDKLLTNLEDQFAAQGVVGYWCSTTDPDDGSQIETLRLLNVPTDSLVAVDRAAFDASYRLFAFDSNFLIDVRDRREVEHGGCYAAEFKKILARQNRRHPHEQGKNSGRPVRHIAHSWLSFPFDLSGEDVRPWLKSGGGLTTLLSTAPNELVDTHHQHLLISDLAAAHQWMPALIDVDQFIRFSMNTVILDASTIHDSMISNMLAANTHYSLAA